MSPEAVGVEGLPEGNVAPGLDAEDAVDTGPVPTETAGASSAVSKSFQIAFNQFFQLIPRDARFPFYDPEFVSADAANLATRDQPGSAGAAGYFPGATS